MSERKNIDRLFQEKFRDFEVMPDEKVWQSIEAELKEKKKRRVIPLWWKVAGVVALLLLGLMVFNRFSSPANAVENNVVTNDPNTNGDGNATGNPSENNTANNGPENSVPNNAGSGQASPNGTTVPANPSEKLLTPNAGNNAVAVSPSAAGSPNKQLHEREINNHPSPNVEKRPGFKKPTALGHSGDAIATSPDKQGKQQLSGDANPGKTPADAIAPNQGIATVGDKKSSQGDLPADGLNPSTTRQNDQKTTNDKLEVQSPQSTGIAANNAEVKKDSAAVATVEPNALEELLNEKENNVTSREQKINRWQITSNVAPIYFSSVSKGSPLDSRFEGNRKSYTTSLSYGMGAKYAINKKLSIKSGVNAVSLEYNTNDIVFFQTENARMIENVKPSVAGAFVQVETKPENNAVTTLGRTRNQYNGEVNQKIGYVEVPVEMTYKLVDKKFGMEVIGGLSTLVLNRNEVSLLSSGLNMNIGEASNLNTVHFSTNVGMGFKYSFLKSFQANLEPMLKYQINTFSNDSGNFKPFFFGIYTGVSYKF